MKFTNTQERYNLVQNLKGCFLNNLVVQKGYLFATFYGSFKWYIKPLPCSYFKPWLNTLTNLHNSLGVFHHLMT